jgi:hypothetical protein
LGHLTSISDALSLGFAGRRSCHAGYLANAKAIHLNPKIGPDWMLCGTQKTVLTPGKNQKRYLAGALNARTGRLTWVEADRKNSQLFILQLWQLVGRDYPKTKRIHVILDNYRNVHQVRGFSLRSTPGYCLATLRVAAHRVRGQIADRDTPGS